MTVVKTFLCCVCCCFFFCCLFLIVFLNGYQQEKTPDVNADAEAQRAAMEARFAKFDAKAATLPYVPIETTEDGLLVLADANFMEAVDQGCVLVVDFWMDGCLPCVAIEPVINGLACRYAGKIRFGKLHSNRNMLMTDKYQVQGFPTLVIFVDGKLTGMLTGMQTSERFQMILDQVLLDHQAKSE